MNLTQLPQEVLSYLPQGHEVQHGVWLVLPADDGSQHSIASVNSWIRAENWYPQSLQSVIWFGDDGVGNFFGWNPGKQLAVLWNPEDGDEPMREGNVNELWQFVLNGYSEVV